MKATAAIEGQAITGAREARNRAWQDDVRDMAHSIRRRVLEHTIEHGGYPERLGGRHSSPALRPRYETRRDTAPMVPPPFNGAPSAKTGSHSGAAYNGPKGADLDRFIVSPTHYALAIYAALIENGRLQGDGAIQPRRQPAGNDWWRALARS